MYRGAQAQCHALPKAVIVTEGVPMTSILRRAQFSASAQKMADLPQVSAAEVVFAGRSNAGKSSAINVLTGRRQLARVSKTPGKTRLINFFELAPARFLVDLPGYGYAKVAAALKHNWEEVLAVYLQQREQICGLVLIMDARHPLTPLDVQLLEWFRPRNRPVLVLLSKADKLSRSQATAQLQQVRHRLGDRYPQLSVLLFSSHNKLGLEQADAVISGWLNREPVEAPIQ